MAAIEEPKGRTAVVKVATGTTASGGQQTANVSIGTLDVSSWDADKAINIISSLANILAYEVVGIDTTLTSSLSAD